VYRGRVPEVTLWEIIFSSLAQNRSVENSRDRRSDDEKGNGGEQSPQSYSMRGQRSTAFRCVD